MKQKQISKHKILWSIGTQTQEYIGTMMVLKYSNQ